MKKGRVNESRGGGKSEFWRVAHVGAFGVELEAEEGVDEDEDQADELDK